MSIYAQAAQVSAEFRPVDPRAICNLILDEAEMPVTNVILQHLLYFSHGMFLAATEQPLVYGYFEAWEQGPRHPAAYGAFEGAGDQPIDFRAISFDRVTRRALAISYPSDPQTLNLVRRVVRTHGRIESGRLMDLAQASNGPWRYILDKPGTYGVFGTRISDNVIIERFKYHKVAV